MVKNDIPPKEQEICSVSFWAQGNFSLFHAMERKVVQYVTASLTWKLCKLTRDRLGNYSSVTYAALDFPHLLPCHPTSFVVELRRGHIEVLQTMQLFSLLNEVNSAKLENKKKGHFI